MQVICVQGELFLVYFEIVTVTITTDYVYALSLDKELAELGNNFAVSGWLVGHF